MRLKRSKMRRPGGVTQPQSLSLSQTRPKAHAARSSWIIGQGGSAGWECRLDNGVDAEPIHVTERREYGESRNSGLRACLEGSHEPVE